MRRKYDTVPVNDKSFRQLRGNIINTPTQETIDVLDAPTIMNELQRAVKKGKPNKAPGSDGISQDFFQVHLGNKHDMLSIVNQMYVERKITDKQKHGMIVCITKKPKPN